MRSRLTITLCTLSAMALGAPAAAGGTNTLVCELRADQVVPPTPSPGHGCGRFLVDTNANTLSYYIVLDGLLSTETIAHIHGPAGPGVNGGVLHGLPLGSPKIGVWNYPEASEADILNGRTYVNIHSGAFPGGEIRGQIAKMAARIDAGQVVPPVACPSAGGWGVFSIDVCTNTLSYHIDLSGALCGVETAAHIHGTATHGANAGVLHALPAGNPKTGSWTYDESVESDLLQGLTYVQVHSDAFPGGVARGQITNIVVPIDGRQQVPPNGSPAVGEGFISLDKDGDVLGYDIRYSAVVEVAAHIHGYAPPGANAGIVHGLPALNPKLGTWSYPAGDEPSLLAGLTYINIHSTTLPGGEIRGQIEVPPKKACAADPCPWDCGDGNGTVDTVDFLALLADWGMAGSPCDFDGNGTVDTVDFLELLAHWGPCP